MWGRVEIFAVLSGTPALENIMKQHLSACNTHGSQRNLIKDCLGYCNNTIIQAEAFWYLLCYFCDFPVAMQYLGEEKSNMTSAAVTLTEHCQAKSKTEAS